MQLYITLTWLFLVIAQQILIKKKKKSFDGIDLLVTVYKNKLLVFPFRHGIVFGFKFNLGFYFSSSISTDFIYSSFLDWMHIFSLAK